MLERRLRTALLATLAICLLPGCGYLTSSGRRQMAYAHYVRKSSHNRVKMQTKFKKLKVPNAPVSEPKITGTSEGPQSVSSSEPAPAQTASPQAPLSPPENQ